MVPMKTSVEDIQKLLGYLGKQVGWVEIAKAEKALGPIDDRKSGAMVEFGLILRDGGNLKLTDLGHQFNSDKQASLRQVLLDVELYRATLEWIHYRGKAETTATEIGQYWEASHSDTLGGIRGETLKNGAVCFGRIVDGANVGSFTVGRGGKETRISFDAAALEALVNGAMVPAPSVLADDAATAPASTVAEPAAIPAAVPSPVVNAPAAVSLTTSPSVHVNIEIHIAADATADTVREIFKNMARYVLDKPVNDEID